MIAKKHRFYGQGGLRYVYRKGETIRGSLCTLRYVHNDRREDYRAAIVVSKKVTKSAPKRNRIRRRLYEIIRLNAPNYLKNTDIAIIVFNEKIATMPADELTDTINELLSQIQPSS
jgi:ribonuclease P protein component